MLNMIDWVELGLISTAVAVGGALSPLLRSLIERMIGHRFDRSLAQHSHDLDRRQLAPKVAEYVVLSSNVSDDWNQEDFDRANRLFLEIALMLPSSVVDQLASGFKPNGNKYDAILAARSWATPNDPFEKDSFVYLAPASRIAQIQAATENPDFG